MMMLLKGSLLLLFLIRRVFTRTILRTLSLFILVIMMLRPLSLSLQFGVLLQEVLIMWRNPYSVPVRFETAVGSPTRPLYKADLGYDGSIELKEDGVDHVYDIIQSYKSSVDINIIMQRYAAGDPYALEQRLGQYGDFTDVPSSYMDVLNAVVDLRTRYETTTMDKPFNEYVSELLSPSDKALKKAVENPVKKEVIEDEQKSE